MWVADTDRAEVLCFGFSPDGATLYTGDDEGAVFAWDRATQEGRELFRAPRALDGAVPVWQVVPTPDGTRLLVPAGGKVYVVDAAGAKPTRKLKAGVTDRGARVSLSADGRRFLTPTKQDVAALWDADTGERVELPGALGKHNTCVWATYLPGDRVLTVSLRGASLRLWDAVTGRSLGECTAERAGVLPHALSADGASFAVVGAPIGYNMHSREVWVYDLGKRERRATIDLGQIPKGLAFRPSGKELTTADCSRSVRTWDATTGEKLGTFHPKIGDVSCVAYSPDGTIWCAAAAGKFAVFDADG